MAVKSATTTTTAKQVTEALARSKNVTTEEEQTLRMRHGARVASDAPLARKAPEGSDSGDELLLMEMQLLKAYRAHQAKAAPSPTASRAPSSSRAKDKIVRALRKKR